MASSGNIEIEKFNGQSFELWKLEMENILVDKDQWITIDPGTKTMGVSDEEWKKLDRKEKSTIRLCVLDSILLNVSGEATQGHYKRDCKSKAPDKGKGSDDAPSAEAKTTSDEGGDAYFASSSTHVEHEARLIDSSASFHFNPHREWFCEYEKYNGGDVFLGDDRKARIIGHGKVKLKLQGGRVRTLPGVLHIPALARNLIFVVKLDDASVKTVFEKDTCKMVQGALALMWGVRIGTLYMLQGSTVIDG
eukprot:PITA_16569